MKRRIQRTLCHMHRSITSNYRNTAQNCIGIPATIVCTIASSSIYKPPPLQFFCVQLQIKISGQHTTWSRWCCTLLPLLSVFMAQGKDTFSKQSHCSRQKKISNAGFRAQRSGPEAELIFHNQWQLHWCQILSNHWAQAQLSLEASDGVTRVWREEGWSGKRESTNACDRPKERDENKTQSL